MPMSGRSNRRHANIGTAVNLTVERFLRHSMSTQTLQAGAVGNRDPVA